jgi:ABC-2 type transport system ATP-binding protein
MENKSIRVENLSKNFKVHLKKEGLWGSIKSLVSREYKTIEAVKDVSFEIAQGEMVGFIGPNGAGKTTTLKMLSGLLYPTSGDVEVLGFVPHKRKEDFLKQISLVMGQKNQLWWDLPAIETFNLNKEIYEVPKDVYKSVLDELVEMLELEDVISQQVRKLSLGQRMKCELVASLLHSPRVLFLDEPTIGLDVVMQKKIREFIKSYNKKYNASVMLTSHYMDDVKEVCKRIIIINKGQIFYDGNIEELIHKYADYKLLIPIFNQKVDPEKLRFFGDVVEFGAHSAVLKVERAKTSQIAAKLLETYDIDDLNINEPELEDIIRTIFSQG